MRYRGGPIQSMLERYAGENALRFHMPGHKGLLELPGASCDVTEVPGTDELFDPREGILEAQTEAARSFHAAGSFLLVNGSTAGIQAMALWAKSQKRSLLLPRNSHISAVLACALADIQPVWIEPEWDAGEQLFRWDAAGMARALPEGKSAVFITYPDYYGRCIDIHEVQAQLNGHDAALLADAAHGAHFAFSRRLPPDAGQAADIWVSGAHKTLPAPTQSAFLHVRDARAVPEIARLLRGVTTTSPSYLLMAGLDNARLYMHDNGALLDDLADGCNGLAERLNGVAGLRCWTDGDFPALGYRSHDPTRIVVDVRGLGFSGWEAGERLRRLGLQAEMCDGCRAVLIATVMDGRERLEGAYRAFAKLAQDKRDAVSGGRIAFVPSGAQAVMTVRQAWLSASEEVGLAEAIGRVAAEPFGAYPPGLPLCMPGEVIPKDAVEAAGEALALGGGLFGVRGGKVSVVAG